MYSTVPAWTATMETQTVINSLKNIFLNQTSLISFLSSLVFCEVVSLSIDRNVSYRDSTTCFYNDNGDKYISDANSARVFQPIQVWLIGSLTRMHFKLSIESP